MEFEFNFWSNLFWHHTFWWSTTCCNKQTKEMHNKFCLFSFVTLRRCPDWKIRQKKQNKQQIQLDMLQHMTTLDYKTRHGLSTRDHTKTKRVTAAITFFLPVNPNRIKLRTRNQFFVFTLNVTTNPKVIQYWHWITNFKQNKNDNKIVQIEINTELWVYASTRIDGGKATASARGCLAPTQPTQQLIFLAPLSLSASKPFASLVCIKLFSLNNKSVDSAVFSGCALPW